MNSHGFYQIEFIGIYSKVQDAHQITFEVESGALSHKYWLSSQAKQSYLMDKKKLRYKWVGIAGINKNNLAYAINGS